MEFKEAVEITRQELLKKYKEVVYKGYEVVRMTKNTTSSSYIQENINIEEVNIEHINNRFTDIEGEITALKINFDIKYPRKRKYSNHEEYYKINN